MSVEANGRYWTPAPERDADNPYYFAGGQVNAR